MTNSTSRGIDNLDNFTIKIAAVSLYKPIQHVINLSIANNMFPMKWKLGKVKPLLKGLDLDQKQPSSYRPICILPTLSKLTEKVVQTQLLQHLEKTGQLHRDHHGYRDKLNTTTALMQITDVIYKSTDKNRITVSMSVDMSAAFDMVRHDLLLQKLKYYKIGQNTLQWIQSYLSHRSSFVEIGEKQSRIVPTINGVPQGSCLGPLLYLIFMNKFPESVRDATGCDGIGHQEFKKLFGSECEKCGILPVFADDSLYLFSGKFRAENQTTIERKFLAIKTFLTENGLSVNDTKTGITEFMCKQKRGRIRGNPPTLAVQTLVEGAIVEKIITDTETCRFLGANLQNNQSWRSHIMTGKRAIIPTIKKQLGAMYRLRDFIPQKSRLILANSIIISRLVYIIPLWGDATNNYLRKVQAVINWGARFVTKKHKRTRTITLMEECRWLTVWELIEFHSVIQLWKILKWKIPTAIYREYHIDNDWIISTIMRPRLQMTSKCFKWRIVKKWNDLSQDLREIDTISIFKKLLRKFIIERRKITRLPGPGPGHSQVPGTPQVQVPPPAPD